VILRFKCARGTEPDFVYETASWSKWLRVGLCAITTGKSILTGDLSGTLDSFLNLFEALKRKDIDAQLTFTTLVEEPFLTSTEQDELLQNLREKGFFKAFEYDAENATWYRVEARELLSSVPEAKQVKVTTPTSGGSAPSSSKPAAAQPVSEFKQPRTEVAESKNTSTAVSSTSNPVQYSSWLLKVGQLVPSQKLRWFVLKDKTVTYYLDQEMSQAKGSFHVSCVMTVSNMENDFWFTVHTSNVHGGKFRLKADSREMYEGWKAAILQARRR
jgi:hypothetical protein